MRLPGRNVTEAGGNRQGRRKWMSWSTSGLGGGGRRRPRRVDAGRRRGVELAGALSKACPSPRRPPCRWPLKGRSGALGWSRSPASLGPLSCLWPSTSPSTTLAEALEVCLNHFSALWLLSAQLPEQRKAVMGWPPRGPKWMLFKPFARRSLTAGQQFYEAAVARSAADRVKPPMPWGLTCNPALPICRIVSSAESLTAP
jgi:hypothetical protein